MLCSVFDLETVVLIFFYCIVLSSFVLFVCSVFPDKFHVRLSHDRIMDLRNDICMYEMTYQMLCYIMLLQYCLLMIQAY